MKESEEHRERALRYAKLADQGRVIYPVLNAIATECIALGDHKLLKETSELMAGMSALHIKIMEHRQLYVSQAALAAKVGD